MSLRAEASSIPLTERLAAFCLALGGLVLSLYLFFPGIATHDALAPYDQAYEWRFGDWQPPLLGIIWTELEAVFGYGPRAIFVPTVLGYWLATILFFHAIRRTGARSAWLI